MLSVATASKSDFEQNEDKNTIQLCSHRNEVVEQIETRNDYDTNLFKSGNYFETREIAEHYFNYFKNQIL